jgi:hypothetical protein
LTLLNDSTIVRRNAGVEGFPTLTVQAKQPTGFMMVCPRSLSGIKKWPVVGFSTLLLIVLAMPSFAADKVRVAFSAVSPSQGVLWVADVGGVF